MTDRSVTKQLCADPGVAYVGWRPVHDDGKREWVLMRSGARELGWWHRHADDPDDFGSNPVDGRGKAAHCRTCGKQIPVGAMKYE